MTAQFVRHSDFGLLSSFDIRVLRHSGIARSEQRVHSMIVSPRAGPTLTIDAFAPASSEMYLTYFLAAEGSCENLRAVCKDVFQPATSSYTGSQFAS
jgi:hypothetical protein